MASVGTSSFEQLVVRQEIRKIVGIYVPMRALVRGNLPNFYMEQKTAILGKNSEKFAIGSLLFYNGKEYGKCKIIGFNNVKMTD